MDINALAVDYEASTQYVADIIGALSTVDLDKHQHGGW